MYGPGGIYIILAVLAYVVITGGVVELTFLYTSVTLFLSFYFSQHIFPLSLSSCSEVSSTFLTICWVSQTLSNSEKSSFAITLLPIFYAFILFLLGQHFPILWFISHLRWRLMVFAMIQKFHFGSERGCLFLRTKVRSWSKEVGWGAKLLRQSKEEIKFGAVLQSHQAEKELKQNSSRNDFRRIWNSPTLLRS